MERGRGGRMDGRGRRDRGRGGRWDSGMGRDMDTDRRPGGFHHRDDLDNRGRDRSWGDEREDTRPAGKGLLGDAPVGLLPAPPEKSADEREARHSQGREHERDRDRRSHSARRDRDDRDRGRDDRRRSDRRRSRERSPDRHSRRSDRERDRSDRRDHGRSRDRDRSSSNRDKDSRPKDRLSKDKDASNGKKEHDKDSGKGDKKTDDAKKSDTETSQGAESKFIHAKGFPANYNYREIRRFFFGSELPFDGIKIINNLQGQRTGEAYLKFVDEDTGKRAMKKNGETIFGNSVSLTYVAAKVFEAQIDSQVPAGSEPEKSQTGPVPVMKRDSDKNNLIVMIRGLPFNVKREDITNFFSSVKLADNGDAVFMEFDSRNQATGVAYLETASLTDFKTAMGYDGREMSNRTLKVSAGRREDMDLCIKKQGEMFQRQARRTADPGQNNAPGIMGPRPPLMGQAPGRPAPQPLLNLSLNPQPLMPPRNGPAFGPNAGPQRSQQPQQQQQQPLLQSPQGEKPAADQSASYCVHIQGLPMLAGYKDIREFFEDLNIVSQRGIQIVHDAMGKPMGEGFVEFVSQEDKDRALKKDKTSMGRHILAVKSVAKADMIERLRNARFVGLPPGQGPPPAQPPFPPLPPHARGMEPPGGPMRHIPPGVLNRQWCYLSCQNFPPAVSIQEILGFFQGYGPIPESIRLHYAADGSPTGNAVVGFNKMDDANHALQDLNGKPCRQSIVTLTPAL